MSLASIPLFGVNTVVSNNNTISEKLSQARNMATFWILWWLFFQTNSAAHVGNKMGSICCIGWGCGPMDSGLPNM